MAENKLDPKIQQTKSELIGAQTQPTTLNNTTKLDIDISKSLIDNIIEASIQGGLNISKLEDFTSIANSRSQIYQLLDTMAADSSVAAIIKTYSEEVCEVADNGHIVWCESTDPKISMYVNYLLNTMNVDKNIYAWVYCLVKYGDVYLKLYRESDYDDALFKKDKVEDVYSTKQTLHEDIEKELDEKVNLNIHKAYDQYSYYAEMVADPSTMFELTKFGKTYGYIETPNEDNHLSMFGLGQDYSQGQNYPANVANYRLRTNDVNIYQADDYVHACLDDNFTRFPEKVSLFMSEEDYNSNRNPQAYTVKRGKSLLYDSYKVWREKSLLENSILLNRITKSSVVRNIQVEVGDMGKTQVQATLRRLKELYEQKSAIDINSGMVEYSNPGPVENNIYTATHNGQGVITVAETGGDIEVKNLGDLDEWVNKFYAAYGIPKAYYGYCDDAAGFNGGTSLAILSSVFAKSVKRIQNAMIQMLTDAINLFLINRGCKSYINNFMLKMKAPLTQEEKDYRDDLSNRINAISSMQSLFSDVEDKGRKLEILKQLIKTLNYGDELLEIIQKEIAAAAKDKLEEEKLAEEESGLNLEDENSEDLNVVMESEPEESESNSAEAELSSTNLESFTRREGSIILNESPDMDYITNDSDLPSPEELNDAVDFTKNE